MRDAVANEQTRAGRHARRRRVRRVGMHERPASLAAFRVEAHQRVPTAESGPVRVDVIHVLGEEASRRVVDEVVVAPVHRQGPLELVADLFQNRRIDEVEDAFAAPGTAEAQASQGIHHVPGTRVHRGCLERVLLREFFDLASPSGHVFQGQELLERERAQHSLVIVGHGETTLRES